jgi:hypothetical protein
MYKRVEKLRRQKAAPRQAMIAGQPHMLAYINEAERQMLKRAGGAEAPGPAGVPAYYTWDSNKSFGENLAGSWNETVTAIKNDLSSIGSVFSGGGGGVDTSFADDVLDNPSNFLPPQFGGSEDADNNGVNDYDEFQGVYNDQLVDAQQNPTGMSTADGVYDGEPYGGNTGTSTVTQTTQSEPVNTGPTAEEIAAAEEAARLERVRKAREAKLGELANAFGFATDDYFQGLGTSYREGGLSEAFTKAYDDALRGIYDVYKSAGLLSQSDVDDDLGILAGAEGGEEGRLNSIVDQYVLANQNYVSGGQSSIADQINALDTVDAINSFNINSAVAPYKEPTEQAVVDFFTDFVKREYDPSYNVDPTAVASGGPRRVSQSVDESGVSGQPSSLAGIFDPVSGNSAKVIK